MAIPEVGILKRLDFKKQLSFAYLTCERMFPNYIFFSENYMFGNPIILREGIDYIYDCIFSNESINQEKIEHLLEMINKNIPDANNHGSYYGTIALYSSILVYESVSLIKKKDVGKSLEVISVTATDIIDCFIQVRDNMDYGDLNFEENILNDATMQNELSIQNGIILYLNNIDSIMTSDIESLMELQKSGIKILTVIE